MQLTTDLETSCIYSNVMSSHFCQVISIVAGKKDTPPRPSEPNDPPFGPNGNLGWAERADLAAKPAITLDTADCLKNDPHYFVRVKLAGNGHCDQAVLAELANDAHRLVRAAVAANPNTARLVVAELTRDADALVRDAARPYANLPLIFPTPKPAEEREVLLLEAPETLCA